MNDDVFCSDRIEEGTYYKIGSMRVVYDIAPVVPGHSLIIPMRHTADVCDLSDSEMLDLFRALTEVKPVLMRLFGDEYGSYDLTMQMGQYSGMSVPHLHMHVIPRRKDDKYQDDSLGDVYTAIEHATRLSPEEYKKRVNMLRKELNWSNEDGNKGKRHGSK